MLWFVISSGSPACLPGARAGIIRAAARRRLALPPPVASAAASAESEVAHTTVMRSPSCVWWCRGYIRGYANGHRGGRGGVRFLCEL